MNLNEFDKEILGVQRQKPAEELRAAAAKLRELARLATPGPWSVCGDRDCWVTSEALDVTRHPDGGLPENSVDPGDAAWIALMGPDKAAAVARLLLHYADSVAWADHWHEVRNCGISVKGFVRAIIGGAQ